MDRVISEREGLVFLDGIPFRPDAEKAAADLRLPRDGDDFNLLRRLLEEAAAAGAPRAVYRACRVAERGEDSVVLGGKEFRSRVLAVNLADAHRVFAYVATCGPALERWSTGHADPLSAWLADYAKTVALEAARTFVFRHVRETWRMPKLSAMAPGSLPDWPLTQQQPLFQLLGDVAGTAGVVLTDSCLMLPTKSVSGILFPAATDFSSCLLCPRENCPGRRAPWDPALGRAKYGCR